MFLENRNMTIDQYISVFGIIITIIFGVIGAVVGKFIRKWRLEQRQNVGRDGIAIQSGRDTNIGSR
jgi:uncharacterized membrane protein YeaQ/YmgE (transglycosylase-associated protein family)